MEQTVFDEKAEEGLMQLFEHFWILRSEKPDVYQLIREREKVLKRYIEDKFGFRLIMHQHFIKMEKIPVEPKSWMGIEAFQRSMDYAIFSCALAFLEQQTVETQFLLTEICEEVRDLYPGMISLDWTNYEHRKSLIRVVHQLVNFSLLMIVEGDLDQFALNQEQEVLYQTTVYSRYFMRSYPDDLFKYDRWQDILNEEWRQHESDYRRKRVYRQLFLSPVVHRKDRDDADFNYIRNFRNRLHEDIDTHTPFKLNLFKNAALMTLPEKKTLYTLFPDQKAIMDTVLQLSKLVRGQPDMMPDEFGEIHLTIGEWETLVDLLKSQHAHGWSKEYRTMSLKALTKEILSVLTSWEMAKIDEHARMVILQPLFGRITGSYPDDYRAEDVGTDDEK